MSDAPVAIPLVGGGLTRRRFLAMAGGTAGALAATAYIRPSFFLGEPAGASPATGNTLVQVFLRGGADGLSLVPPLGDSTYQSPPPGHRRARRHRPSARRPLRPPPGGDPAQGALRPGPPRHRPGRRLAEPDPLALRGPGPDREGHAQHDDHARRVVRAVDEPDGQRVGGDPPGPRVGYGLQAALRGSSAVATPDISSLALRDMDTITWSGGSGEMTGALAGMYAASPDGLLKSQGGAAITVVNQLAPVAADSDMPADWPQHFGSGLWPIARLLAAGIPVEAAAADLGGWDTHDAMGSPTNVNGGMYQLVAELDAALGSFFSYLGPLGDKVTVVVMAEFGRRIAVNGSGGLDHGRGQAMMVVGGGVSGGVKGAWPGLTDTDSGDVRVVNDYRAVLSEVLSTRMRATDLGTVFPGFDTSSASWLGVTTP